MYCNTLPPSQVWVDESAIPAGSSCGRPIRKQPGKGGGYLDFGTDTAVSSAPLCTASTGQSWVGWALTMDGQWDRFLPPYESTGEKKIGKPTSPIFGDLQALKVGDMVVRFPTRSYLGHGVPCARRDCSEDVFPCDPDQSMSLSSRVSTWILFASNTGEVCTGRAELTGPELGKELKTDILEPNCDPDNVAGPR